MMLGYGWVNYIQQYSFYLPWNRLYNIMLSTSSCGEPQPCPQSQQWKAKSSMKTSQTLSQLPSTCAPDLKVYQSGSATEWDVVAHTLAHGRLQWLDRQLQGVLSAVNQCMTSDQAARNRGLCFQHLDQLSERTQNNLAKLAQFRSSVRQKLMKTFLLQSKQTNRKNVLKANLLKYKQSLLTLKLLRDRKLDVQNEVIQLKSRLKTSGLVLVPSLIEKSVVKLALQCLITRQNRVQILQKQHIRLIVDNFMGDASIMRQIFQQTQRQSLQSNHEMFLRFKMYILLKTYLDTKMSITYLDAVCQGHIKVYHTRNLHKISEMEYRKIRSLVQCDHIVASFMKDLAMDEIGFIFSVFKNITYEIGSSNERINTMIIDKIAKINKKSLIELQKVQIPYECMNIIEQNQQSLFPSNERVNKILSIFQERSFLIQIYSSQLPHTISSKELQINLLLQWTRLLVEPIFKLQLLINDKSYQNKEEKHYQKSRTLHRVVDTWLALLRETEDRKQVTDKITECLGLFDQAKLNEKCCRAKNIERTLIESKILKSVSLAQFIAQYNQSLGQTYLYLTNKLANLLNRNSTQSHPLSSHGLTCLWVNLISEPLSQHLRLELQPATVLKNVTFLQYQIIGKIDEQHKVENQLDAIYAKLCGNSCHNKDKRKGKSKTTKEQIDEQQVDRVHMRVLQLNMKVRQYTKLIAISQAIEVTEQICAMNEKIYSEIIKKVTVQK